MYKLRKSELYRFPWSKNDNPIGWLEVTDVCNIHCKGCYRQNLEGHRPVEDLEEEVLTMKEFRSIDNVSIAGGEPLCHPRIDDLIEFIHKRGIKPYLLTNGKAVTEERMRELKKRGLAGVAFHVDMMQNRPGWEGKDEIGLLPLRDQYVDVMASVRGIPTSFGITVYKDNFEQIPELVRWGIKNIKYVQGQTFITYRGALVKPGVRYVVQGREVDMDEGKLGYATTEEPDRYDITSNDVYDLIKRNVPGYGAAAYLGGTERHDSFKWLISFMVGSDDGWYGAVGPKTVEFSQAAYHLLRGSYFAYSRKCGLGRKVFLAGLFDPEVRRLARRFLSNPLRFFYKPVYGQSIGIIQAPDVLPDGRVDMCDACPDLTLYKGQFVHSCRMDEWRRWGGYATQIRGDVAEAEEEAPPARKRRKCRAAPV
ncbi:MAG: radical SAM protein [candidate division Zixibacteria bacterium]|nr:radical SAM protein [candidate division Zixibacteria bacterium]